MKYKPNFSVDIGDEISIIEGYVRLTLDLNCNRPLTLGPYGIISLTLVHTIMGLADCIEVVIKLVG